MLPSRLVGARLHNLDIGELEVRPFEVTVVTGVSGAGKSSLAMDTLYAEGQRRFVESFSPYARQFLERLERPPVDQLEPVGAGVAVDRSAPIKSSRSTLATMADLEPYLAGLFSKESIPHCPEHGIAAEEMTAARAAARVLDAFSGEQVVVTAPLLVGDRAEYLGLREDLLREGYRRVVVRGEVVDIDTVKPSDAAKEGRLYVALDRIVATPDRRARLLEALEGAFRRSRGALTEGHSWIFAAGASLHLREGLTCPTCARGFLPPRPGYFSYESPLGACESCRGFGRILGIDADRVIPDTRLSLAAGAIRPWRGEKSAWEQKQLFAFCKAEGIPTDVPWAELPESARALIFSGKGKGKSRFYGVSDWFSWLESKSYKMHVRVLLSRYRSYDPCPTCEGTRLTESSRAYKLGGLDLGEWHRLSVDAAHARLRALALESPHGRLSADELTGRLGYLGRVGLGYLTLDRQARTLSGGEAQRVTLTAALGTSLSGALFVLDEPTVGLHPEDVTSLAELLRELADRGNTVLVIEHDARLIRAADRVIELGPGSGPKGGRVVFDGTPAEAEAYGGATARALGAADLTSTTASLSGEGVTLRGVTAHNLKDIDVTFPLGGLVCVSGPSGSGKSSLLVDVLYRAVAKRLGDSEVERPEAHRALEGAEQLSAVELVDQAPLGRTSRGNAATYTKCWDHVRKLFASEPSAVVRGLLPSHFSFNVEGGRCPACSGEGFETVEMQFLADVSLVCPTCQGKRFQPHVLDVRVRGRSISDVLDLSVDEAISFFAGSTPITKALAPLSALGLSYLRLGQPLSTLSGGEAQRLKLARSLAAPGPGRLYVLDEPSAGLHADEVAHVVRALRTLVRAGGSVIFVDHDLSLIAAADHVIELGPGGGEAGGQVVFTGTPAELARTETKTGRALRSSGSGPERAAKKDTKARGKVSAKAPEKAAPSAALALRVTGATEHTLKNVSAEVPHGALTVVTGPSGSGKSTLAFDVIFAEGQRRFLETLTPYARRFLPTMPRPSVDAVDGVPPSIALEQRTTRMGARSTVATVTEVAHYLRLLFAKVGVPHCPDHQLPIGQSSSESLLEVVRGISGSGTLLSPVVRGRKGTYLDVFTSASRANVPFAVADGKRVSTAEPPRLAKTKEHDIDLVLGDAVRFSSLAPELLSSALSFGQGAVVVEQAGKRREFSLGGACPTCGFSAGELDPRHFSFNTRQGQCEVCEGTGLAPAKATRGRKAVEAAERAVCSACGGERLSPLARAVRLPTERAARGAPTYPELVRLSIAELAERVQKLRFSGRNAQVAEPILPELTRRIGFLIDVGLDYLTLDRDASTLSGGELQRLRLAAQLGSGLTGALYVLDEPTIGLHPRDTRRLIDNLEKLVKMGSTVLCVEHDEDVIRAADHLLDMGPRGGRGGGELVASGPPARVLADPESPTGQALGSARSVRPLRHLDASLGRLKLERASLFGLSFDALEVPLGRMTVVAGVSGSGKSTLIRKLLLPTLGEALASSGRSRARGAQAANGSLLTGIESLRRAIAVDQSPIGRTPRSVPATFLGIFDVIRKLFAQSREAQVRGFDAGRFSFNAAAGGRCPNCEGQGVVYHEMSFLPDVVTTCPMCEGLRFEDRTLEVRYLGKNIGEVLAMSAEEAVEVFAAHPKITRPLEVLRELGAGYVSLGQGSHTLSGGEAQRLKLAAELSAGARHEATLYVLDEPTTGLHVSDVDRLVSVLDRLVERGDTLVVIEHQPDVIAAADWVVELGPEGGPNGGHVVFAGTPLELRKKKTPTGRVLAERGSLTR